jgi:ribosomal protein L11 methylase PrmA
VSAVLADPASFRDPSGRVFLCDSHVYRTVSTAGLEAFTAAHQSGALRLMAEKGRLVETRIIDGEPAAHLVGSASHGLAVAHVLQHPRLPVISYPFEWPYEALRAAALAHLDLHLDLIALGFTLSDGSAYNMQFDGPRPIHIDVLSVIPYSEGARWLGYGQFLRQFLNPLVFEAETGVSFAPWYRGSLDGMASDDVLRLLPWRSLTRPAHLMHVAAPALFDRRAARRAPRIDRDRLAPLPKTRLVGFLRHLRLLIAGLPAPHKRTSSWADYEQSNPYEKDERAKKRAAVRAFVSAMRPRLLLDLGCNTGLYSRIALQDGAERVVGLDTDRAALDACYLGAAREGVPLLTLAADITNPSPSQGWRGSERPSLVERLGCDALLALALLHHIVVRNNIALADAVRFLVSLAPRGLIEFVPKSDPQVARLLRLREDIFADYREDVFRAVLLESAAIVGETPLGEGGRRLFTYVRRGGAGLRQE